MKRRLKHLFSADELQLKNTAQKEGNPEIDVAYQYLRYFFEEDDSELNKIREEYISGELLTGEIKAICVDKATTWMVKHHELRDQNQHLVKDFLN